MTETPSDPERSDDSAPAHRAPSRRLRRLLRAVVVLPIVVAVVRALVSGWFPVGDNALLAVRAYDVGTSHHPLLGSWTSASLALGVDVNNPGPLYPDLVAPFMWTVGRLFGIGAATALGVGAVNVAAALGTLAAADRMGGWRAERWMLVAVAALAWAMGSELLIDIWQPHALMLPFLCLLALTTAVVAGHLRLVPWWLGLVSLIVQTHLAFVYVVAVLGLLVLGVVGRRVIDVARRDEVSVVAVLRGVIGRRITAVSGAVLAIAWVQPVIEQVTGPGEGNLRRLATNAGGGELTVGAASAVKIVAAVVAIPPGWTRWGFEDAVPSTPLTQTPAGPQLVLQGLPGGAVSVVAVLAVAAVLAGLAATLRSHDQRAARAASLVSLAGVCVAIAGLTIQTVSVTGLGNHQVRWIFALAVFVHVSIVWGVVELVRARRASGLPVRAGSAPAAAAVVLALATVPFHAHDLGPTADRESGDTLERVFDDLDGFDPGGPVIYDTSNIRVFEPYSWAVVMRLRELGVETRFEGEIDVRQYGEGRRVDGSEVGRVRQFERSDALLYEGDACTLSLRSGVSAADEQHADELIARAVDDLSAGTLAIDTTGLPDELIRLVDSSLDGSREAAFRFVAQGLVPVLVDEGRVDPSPGLAAAAAENDDIIARVNSTLRVVVEPASLCDGR
jgi:hypothetical protein